MKYIVNLLFINIPMEFSHISAILVFKKIVKFGENVKLSNSVITNSSGQLFLFLITEVRYDWNNLGTKMTKLTFSLLKWLIFVYFIAPDKNCVIYYMDIVWRKQVFHPGITIKWSSPCWTPSKLRQLVLISI